MREEDFCKLRLCKAGEGPYCPRCGRLIWRSEAFKKNGNGSEPEPLESPENIGKKLVVQDEKGFV